MSFRWRFKLGAVIRVYCAISTLVTLNPFNVRSMEFTSFGKGRADPSHLLPNCYSHHQCTDLSHKPNGVERAATYKEVTLILVLEALGIWNCVFALNKQVNTAQVRLGTTSDTSSRLSRELCWKKCYGKGFLHARH